MKKKIGDDEYEFKCISCGKKIECDLWYLQEIEAGREEQMCDKCKDKY